MSGPTLAALGVYLVALAWALVREMQAPLSTSRGVTRRHARSQKSRLSRVTRRDRGD